LCQSDSIDQIVLVDDASTDNSVSEMREQIRNLPQAKIVINERCLGTMGALNVGLEHANCDYVMFLASNDYAMNGVFSHAKACIARAGCPGVWSAMVWTVDESGNPLSLYPSAVVSTVERYLSPEQCLNLAWTIGNWFTGTTLLYHRQTLQQIGGFDGFYQGWADYIAALTLASLKGAFFCPRPLGVMRRHGGGYLWRTITDPQRVEAILARIESVGPGTSSALFTRRFCERLRHRFRHSCFNAIGVAACPAAIRPDYGMRYAVLRGLLPVVGWSRALMFFTSFLIVKPFDLVSIFRYKVLGLLWARTRDWYRPVDAASGRVAT
jgi:glycosyltransferase involved in cell wall biosynthesis